MKQQYLEPKKWTTRKREIFEKIVTIVEEYQEQGYRMTLRQLYYQLVSRDVIPNQASEYAKLSTLLTEARMYGFVDWDFIEDRVRKPKKVAQWDSIQDIANAAVKQYRRDRWANQEYYVEVWVEKDALSGVLEPITRKYDVTLMVNRGYSSASAMHESAERFIEKEDGGKQTVILYLGDHDPSGMDMVRDIQERMQIFGSSVEVKRIALNYDQIKKFNPPPNPAKFSDPRASNYVAEFGRTSWELDALSPKDLNKLLKDELEQLLDIDAYNLVCRQEEFEKQQLDKLVGDIDIKEVDEDELPASDEEL